MCIGPISLESSKSTNKHGVLYYFFFNKKRMFMYQYMCKACVIHMDIENEFMSYQNIIVKLIHSRNIYTYLKYNT